MSLAEIINRSLTPLLPQKTFIPPRNQLRYPVKVVLFDVYGTLLVTTTDPSEDTDLTADSEEKLTQLLQRFGITISLPECQKALNITIMDRHQHLRRKGIDYPEVIIETIWQSIFGWQDLEKAKRFALEYELLVNPVWTMPHLQKLLKRLQSDNILMGIISNAQFYTSLILETITGISLEMLGFDPELTFFSYQHQQAKPSAHLFEQAARQLAAREIEPRHILYVGNDMQHDILPAYRIGFQTALFAGDASSLRLHHDDLQCRKFTPDVIVTDLMQLETLFH